MSNSYPVRTREGLSSLDCGTARSLPIKYWKPLAESLSLKGAANPQQRKSRRAKGNQEDGLLLSRL